MLTKPDKNLIFTSRTPTNLAADLWEVNKKLHKLHRRASFVHGVIQITDTRTDSLCAEVWDEAGVIRYIDRLLATYEQPYC